jgi:hypothetical protein
MYEKVKKKKRKEKRENEARDEKEAVARVCEMWHKMAAAAEARSVDW